MGKCHGLGEKKSSDRCCKPDVSFKTVHIFAIGLAQGKSAAFNEDRVMA